MKYYRAPLQFCVAVLILAEAIQIQQAKADPTDAPPPASQAPVQPAQVEVQGVTLPAGTNANSWKITRWRWLFASKLDLSVLPNDATVSDLATWAVNQHADGGNVNWFSHISPGQDPSEDLAPVPNGSTATLQGLIKYEDRRELMAAPQIVAVGYVYLSSSGTCNSDDAAISFKEAPRQKAVTVELNTLAKKAYGAPPGGAPSYVVCMIVETHQLVQDRATLDVSVQQNNKSIADTNILTGSREPFFFTADAIYSGVSQLNYDSTTHALKGAQAPNNPLIAINWLPWGDPYKNYTSSDVSQRLAVKFAASASSPKTEYGLGLGYTFKTGTFDASDTSDSFMFFVAYMCSVGNTGVRSYSWRWGLSYNLGAFGTGGSGK